MMRRLYVGVDQGWTLQTRDTGGSKWLRLLVHVSLCSVLFVIAPDRDPSAGDNTSALSAHCDSAVIYLTCGASELEPVSVVTADRSSAFIKTSTLFMFCIRLASKVLIHTQINEK